MSGQKRKQSPTPNKAAIEKWEERLADLQRRVYVQHKSGMTDTVWDAQIEQLEKQIAGEKSVGVILEVETDGK